MDDDEIDPAQEMLNEGAPPPPAAPAIDYQKMYEAMQAQNAQIMQQNAQLAQTVQQVAARPIAPAVAAPDPFAAFDDKTAAALRSVVEAQNNNFKQQFAAQEQNFKGMQLKAEADSIAGMNLDPEIAKRAQAIFIGNRNKGVPLTAAEAADFAIGEAVRNGTFKGTVPGQHQNRGPATIPGGSRTPAPTKNRPANFDKMSRKEQIAHYESDENLHSAPIQGIWDDADV